MDALLTHISASVILAVGIILAADQINDCVSLDDDEFLPVYYKKIHIPFWLLNRGNKIRFSAYLHLRLGQMLLLFEIIFIILGRLIVGDFSFVFDSFMMGYLNFEVACLFVPRILIWCYVKIRKSFQQNHYKFLHDKACISVIEIARYEGKHLQKETPEITILRKVIDNNCFLKKFRKINGYKAACPGESGEMENGSVVIKISYCNGDYELIGALNQLRYIYEYDLYDKDAECMIFSKKEFSDVISLYLNSI